MRTLICEFQPFHSLEVDYHFDTYTDPDGRRRNVHTGQTVRKSGTPGKHYHYAYVGTKAVKRGDWALVHNGSEFGICEIKRVVPGIDAKVTKHVIEVLLRTEFEAYLKRNQEVDELRGAMDELAYRFDQHKLMDKYKGLAETDPRAKELLDKLQATLNPTTQIEGSQA